MDKRTYTRLTRIKLFDGANDGWLVRRFQLISSTSITRWGSQNSLDPSNLRELEALANRESLSIFDTGITSGSMIRSRDFTECKENAPGVAPEAIHDPATGYEGTQIDTSDHTSEHRNANEHKIYCDIPPSVRLHQVDNSPIPIYTLPRFNACISALAHRVGEFHLK